MIDTRVWMYRDGEAVCFASLQAVPKGKGWSDVPSQMTAACPDQPRPAQPRPNEAELLLRLRSRASALGIRFHRNAGIQKLTQLIEDGEKHGPQS